MSPGSDGSGGGGGAHAHGGAHGAAPSCFPHPSHAGVPYLSTLPHAAWPCLDCARAAGGAVCGDGENHSLGHELASLPVDTCCLLGLRSYLVWDLL